MTGHSARPPLVSVIVPTHQRRDPVRRAVASVWAQTFRDFELIVVDDGSTDGTEAALAAGSGRLRYVWQKNAGAASARNAGLRLARGHLVAFLDSDDRWLPDHLALVVRALEAHPEAVLAYSQSTLQPRPRVRAGTGRLRDPLPGELVGNHVGALPCAVARRDAVAAVGGFDERLAIAEDTDLWLRLAARGGAFVEIPRRTVVAQGETPGSLLTGRPRGDYVKALRASTERVISELEHSDGGMTAAAAGRRHFIRALGALAERDDRTVREALEAACRLLPELSESPAAIVGHVRFNVAGTSARGERARQLAELARLWPDRDSAVARVVPAHALVDALAAGRMSQARQVARGVPPRLAVRVLGSRLHRRCRRRLPAATPETMARSAQRVVLQTGHGPLRPVWRGTHVALARLVAAYLRGGSPSTGVYLRGSLARGESVFGLSDIDLVVVCGDGERVEADRREVIERWRALGRRVPALRDHLLETPPVYGEAELKADAARTTLTHGLAAGKLTPSTRERRREGGGAERGGLYGLTSDWRLLTGRDLRPPALKQTRSERRVASWMELQYWWLQAFRLCVEPAAPWAGLLCAKLLTEPARIWLWLVRGERFHDREALMRRAAEELPEEQAALAVARALFRSTPSVRVAPVAEALASLARMSIRLAGAVTPEPGTAGATRVRLLRDGARPLLVRPALLAALARAAGTDHPPDALPLVDWRARVWSLPDECLAIVPGAVTDRALLAAAALTCNDGVYAGLREDGLMVLPSLLGSRLRAVQCAASDPVSFALASGYDHAVFPDAPGWSARDGARRAAAEHLGWLRDGGRAGDATEELGRLLTAARSALFHESVEAGAPELALEAASIAERLGGDLAHEASEQYRAGRLDDTPPDPRVLEDFRTSVERLFAGLPDRVRA